MICSRNCNNVKNIIEDTVYQFIHKNSNSESESGSESESVSFVVIALCRNK